MRQQTHKIVFFTIFLFFSCKSIPKSVFFPFYKNGTWGYIDCNGKEVIPAQFDHAYEFRRGIAAIKKDSLYGFINEFGEIIIEPVFKWVIYKKDNILVSLPSNEDEFVSLIKTYENMENLEYNEKDKFFYNRSNTLQIKFSSGFHTFNSYSNGLFRVVTLDRNEYTQSYYNKNGIKVFSVEEYSCGDFHEGFAIALNSFKGKKMGFINKRGKIALPLQYDAVLKEFCNGIACVVEGEDWGYINKKGKWVFRQKMPISKESLGNLFGEGYHCDCYSGN